MPGRHLDYNALASREGYAYHPEQPGALVRICHQPVNPKAHLSNLLLTMATKWMSRSSSSATAIRKPVNYSRGQIAER